MAASAFIIGEMAAGGVLGLRFSDLFCTRRCRAPMQIDSRRYSLEHGTSLGCRERLDDLFAYPRRQRRRAATLPARFVASHEPAPLGIREYRSRETPRRSTVFASGRADCGAESNFLFYRFIDGSTGRDA